MPAPLPNPPKNFLFNLDKNGEPQECSDFETWAKGFEGKRVVANITLSNGRYISTIFLGLNTGIGDAPPRLWETMVFRAEGGEPMRQERCGGPRANALAMHKKMVNWAWRTKK